MKVTVTGASGFLGRRIVAELASCGMEVVAVARRDVPVGDGIESRLVENYDDVPEADVLVHLAEESRLHVAEQSPDHHRTLNVERVRGFVRSRRFPRILYGSSGAVYGDNSPYPHRADEVPAGTSAYACSKLACEREVLAEGGVVLRFANIVGPGMSDTAVLARVLAQIPGSGDLAVRDDSAVRDFLWNGDMATCVTGFVAGHASGVFNVGSGEGTSVRQLAELALTVAGESHRKVVSGPRAGRPSQLILDVAATRAAINWQPRARLDAAIRQILESRHV